MTNGNKTKEESQPKATSLQSSNFIAGLLTGAAGSLLLKSTSTSKEDISQPAILFSLDNIITTLDEQQLVSLASALVKCSYLRTLSYLDNEWRVQHTIRTRRHLSQCASSALKTPFATKVVVMSFTNGLDSSLLLSDSSFAVKTIKITQSGSGTFIKKGVNNILSTILSSDSSVNQIDVISSKMVGSSHRFNISPVSTLNEAVMYFNKPISDFEDIKQALSYYYAQRLSMLTEQTRSAITHEKFQINCFITLNFKENGMGYLTNFNKLWY